MYIYYHEYTLIYLYGIQSNQKKKFVPSLVYLYH